jgi:hypothetical protein
MGLPLCGVVGILVVQDSTRRIVLYVSDIRMIIHKYEKSMAQMVCSNEILTKGGIIIVVASDAAFIL